jgi:TolB protein
MGKVAYIGPDQNLYTLDPITNDVTAITDDGILDPGGDSIVYGAPTWAPVTGQIAFTRTRIGPDGGHKVDLLVNSGQPGESVTMFSDSARTPFYLYWSPNGDLLSFLASSADGGLGIYVARTGESAQLLDQGQPYYWVWTPDGEGLLSHVGGSAADNPARARLAFFQGDPLEARALDLAPADFQAPDIAPDGMHLLLASRKPGAGATLQMVDMQTGGAVQLIELSGPVGFGWSPAGNSIALLTLPGSGQESFGSLGWIDMSSPDRPQVIADVASNVVGFFWSPSGDRLAYLVPELVTPGSQQQVADRRQGQSGQLILHLFVIAANSRQSTKVADFSPTDDFIAIMPFFDQYERSMTIWSPDGTRLVYTDAGSGGPAGVYVVDADGGNPPHRVADGSFAVWSWR